MLKRAVHSTLELAGLQVRRIKHAPYEEVLSVPRFTEHTVTLLGHDFKVADAATFYGSYREIFDGEIYRFIPSSDAPRVIDCGSNYGVSIAYLKHVYPNARITGVEADPNIFGLLRHNCSHMDVELLNKAVSGSREPLQFFCEGSDGGRAGNAIEGAKAVTVDAVTLDELIDGPVDFLKIDIEGSETDAMLACTKLSLVRNLFVEYHCFKGKEQTLDRLLACMRENGLRYYIREQGCSKTPLISDMDVLGMDLQLNIFAKR